MKKISINIPDLTVKSDAFGVWVKNLTIITSSEIVKLDNPMIDFVSNTNILLKGVILHAIIIRNIIEMKCTIEKQWKQKN